MTAIAIAKKGPIGAEVALILLVIGILVVLFAPIPARVLDFLILLNVCFALLMLLLTFYMERPVEFSTFPSLLLIATLFRLALNVAATRLILSDADAGMVISAVGSYVVGGNYVIGLIVFLILVVVQFVVVTSGAQRVSEVAARFTLDSMPGQQMSIDADLNMGLIDQAEAKRRRRGLEREAAFYGAMDGASKFVKGDAIAGLVILLINIIGGLVIGVMQMGMPWSQALKTFTLLTIGDGIVTQVPALIISVGTGIIVTRSGSDTNLSSEVFRQLGAFPKAFGVIALALLGLLALPGLPMVPVLVLLMFIGAGGALMMRARANEVPAEKAVAAEESGGLSAPDLHQIEPIEVHLGASLASFAEGGNQQFVERISVFRKQFAHESGFVVPAVRLRAADGGAPDTYSISVFGVPVARGRLDLTRTLAIAAGPNVRKIPGVETREPTYGLPAVWIDDAHVESARSARYTLVDPTTVLLTHLVEVIKRQAPYLLTRSETDRMIALVRHRQPGLIEEFIPNLISVGDVQKVLQNLLRERVSIRNLDTILEALCDAARTEKDPATLTEMVRARLAPAICHAVMGEADAMQVLTFDPELERQLVEGVRAAANPSGAAPFVVNPRLAEVVLKQLVMQVENMMKSNLAPVLLCAPELRRHIRAFSERSLPHLSVLSMTEIAGGVHLKAFGTVAV